MLRQAREEKMAAWRAGLTDILHLDDYILEHQRMLWDMARSSMNIGSIAWKGISTDWYPIVETVSTSFRYSELVSNTHSAPLTGVTNWGGRKEDAPRGYPGFVGSIEWRTRFPEEGRPKNISSCIAGSLFSGDLVGINTGTGGSRGAGEKTGIIRYQYSVSIFLDDWIGLKRSHFLECLSGRKMETA